MAFYCFGVLPEQIAASDEFPSHPLTIERFNDDLVNYFNKDKHDDGLTYIYGFMYNFVRPFVEFEMDKDSANTIVGIFPIPLIIGLWYLFKNNKHYEFLFPIMVSMVLMTIFTIMGSRMPSVISMIFLLGYTNVEYFIFAIGFLGLIMVFYLMSNDDKNMFSLQATIWIAMACLVVTVFVPLPAAIADKNWRTLFCAPYILLSFLMLNYNKEKKYQRWFMWNLAIVTIFETSICLFA